MKVYIATHDEKSSIPLGAFSTLEAASAWIDDLPDGDYEIHERTLDDPAEDGFGLDENL